jgi:putative transposase
LGSRRLRETLRDDKRVQRLMRQMGIAVLGPKPRGKPAPGHKVHPYLLRELVNMHKNAWLN